MSIFESIFSDAGRCSSRGCRSAAVNRWQRRAGGVISALCQLDFDFVIDHPYAAVTDAEGQFSIPDLPPGNHSFVVWHESVQGNFVQRKLAVTVKAGETTDMTIDLPAGNLALK